MPEVSAADLRRLGALEGRLEKTTDERKRLTAERRKLRAEVTANARRVRELEKEIAASKKQLDAALAENASLAARIDDSSEDLERIQAASVELRGELDAAGGELEKATESSARARDEVRSLGKERDALAESLAIANEQLAGKSVAPVLSAKQVSRLVHDLVDELGSSLSGMTIRDGELQLRVGFEKVGRATGFVVPSSASPPELREGLHQISVRFGSSSDAPDQ